LRITNLTSGFRLKRSQAENRIDQCISCWVVQGQTIRDLTLAERVNARSEQARLIEPLALAECHGLKVINLPHLYEERQLARDANLFAINCENAA